MDNIYIIAKEDPKYPMTNLIREMNKTFLKYELVYISEINTETDQLNALMIKLLTSDAGIRRKIVAIKKLLAKFEKTNEKNKIKNWNGVG